MRAATKRKPYAYGLIELTPCPRHGEILRTEMLTDLEAARKNAAMSGTIIEWRKLVLHD